MMKHFFLTGSVFSEEAECFSKQQHIYKLHDDGDHEAKKFYSARLLLQLCQ